MRLFCTTLAVISTFGFTAAAVAESVQGSYVEARSIPRPAAGDAQQQNGQLSQVVMAWQIRQGSYDGQKLDGQTIIAVVTAEPSPGGSFGQTKTVFIVDRRTSTPTQKALVHLAKDLAPAAIHDAGTVVKSEIDVRIAEGCGCGAAVVESALAKARTRRPIDADQALLGATKNEKPLGEVFASNQAIATEFSCGSEPAGAATSVVTAFTGSFSK